MRTQLELLQWHLDIYSTERPTYDTVYFLESNNRHNKSLDQLTGEDIYELMEAGLRPSIDQYIELTKRVSPKYLELITDYNTKPKNYKANGLTHIRNLFMDLYGTNENYNKVLKPKGLNPITNDLLETILNYYLIYNGVRGGWLDDRAPKDLYDIGDLYTEELIHIYYLLNGIFKPTKSNPIELWRKGNYTDYSYNKIKFIVKHIVSERPDLIGKNNIQIQRELRLNELLT
jgi:hypothetical protein